MNERRPEEAEEAARPQLLHHANLMSTFGLDVRIRKLGEASKAAIEENVDLV